MSSGYSAYKLLYGVGYAPWEQMAKSPMITEQITSLFGREEAGREPPYGRALDLGCGSGIWAVELAARGWQVTGVDFVPKALRRARARAKEAGVELQLAEADVTALAGAGIGSEFRLTAFPEWTITDDEAMDVTGAPKYVRRADPRFYRLRRN